MQKYRPQKIPTVWYIFSVLVIFVLFLIFMPANFRTRSEDRFLYLAHCSPCHGENGHGEGRASQTLYFQAKDFRTLPTELFENIEKIQMIIAAGIQEKAMPSFANELDATEIKRIASYVQVLSKERLP